MGIVSKVKKLLSKKVLGIGLGVILVAVALLGYFGKQEWPYIGGVIGKIKGIETTIIEKLKAVIPKRA